jgi:hypothetical protein
LISDNSGYTLDKTLNIAFNAFYSNKNQSNVVVSFGDGQIQSYTLISSIFRDEKIYSFNYNFD